MSSGDYSNSPVASRHPALFLACIGNTFMDGVREAAEAATVAFANATGGMGIMWVQPNLTVISPLGLGDMRNFMVERACLGGFDWIALLDNDVVLETDTMTRLAAHSRDFVVPFFDQSALGAAYKLTHPVDEPRLNVQYAQGLRELAWTVPYCNLIRTSVFQKIGYRPFTGSMIYCEDEFNSMHFLCHGVRIWQDTDTVVKLLRPPRLLCDTIGKASELKILKPFEMP